MTVLVFSAVKHFQSYFKYIVTSYIDTNIEQ
jgi:hypothetical protein